MNKKELNQLASAVANAEGKKSQVSIGNIREIISILHRAGFLMAIPSEYVGNPVSTAIKEVWDHKILRLKKRKKVGCVVRQGRKTSKK